MRTLADALEPSSAPSSAVVFNLLLERFVVGFTMGALNGRGPPTPPRMA